MLLKQKPRLLNKAGFYLIFNTSGGAAIIQGQPLNKHSAS